MLTSSYFLGKSHFGDDEIQTYLASEPVLEYFMTAVGSNRILAQKSKGLTEESIKPPATLDNNLVLGIIFNNTKIQLKFHEVI